MSVYDRPFKYLRTHNAYLVTVRTPTKSRTGLYDVVPDGVDRALPLGFIETSPGAFIAYHYHPAHVGDASMGSFIAGFTTRDEAIAAVLNTPRESRYPLGYMQDRGAS